MEFIFTTFDTSARNLKLKTKSPVKKMKNLARFILALEKFVWSYFLLLEKMAY